MDGLGTMTSKEHKFDV